MDMQVTEMFDQIHPAWLSRVSHAMAEGEGVRESFLLQLDRFWESLQKAVVTGDASCLDPLLIEWAQARTQTELEEQETSLPPILRIILLLTFDVAHEALNDSDALVLIGKILPVYTYALEFTTRLETQLHIDHFSKELEKATSELKRLDKSKSDFIAVAAHELKTPLTLIEGYASMLKEQLIQGYDPSQIELYLQGVDTGGHRLREIVDDMIDVSMIDNNMLSINFQPLWLNRLLRIVEAEFAEPINERNQTLIINPFPGSDQMTFGDGDRLFQAFRNVIANAIKYTPDGGTITVDGRLLPGFVEVTISDDGIGIDPDDYNRIFEKFGRLGNVALHSSSKTKFKGGGPGLGLPIAKGIIEAHGGAIWVESEGYDEVKCPGSTFHILLPMRKEIPDDKIAKLFRSLNEPVRID